MPLTPRESTTRFLERIRRCYFRRRDATDEREAVSQDKYDAVIVGSGVAGAIIAKELAEAGKRVLILEAGSAGRSLQGYEDFLNRFYATPSKDNQSPYPINPNAPMPRSTDAHKIIPGPPGHLGLPGADRPASAPTRPTPASSAAPRCTGRPRSCACCPRTSGCGRDYGQGLDWPIDYDEIEPYYADGRARDRRLGRRRGRRAISAPGSHGLRLPDAGPAALLPRQDGGQGIDGTTVDLYGEALRRSRSGPSRRAATASPTRTTTAARASRRSAR